MEIAIAKKRFFTKSLLKWFSTNHRPLPWKGEKNPYFIWLSEIILQQTRVEQGLPYFEKFKQKYPTIKKLADAPEDEVMKMWEGLGYYSRARNLHTAAKYVAYDLKGRFPKTYKEIIELKGVGPYTAAAVASFAYDLPHAVVDGNVYRVLSRVFGIETPIDSTAGKKLFAKLAQELLDEKQAGNYNQAIMDFGATHCTPALPKCKNCLMQKKCAAFQTDKINELPIKSKKIKRRQRFFNYIILNKEENVFIRKRTEKDIWQNLYEFPLIETDILLEEKKHLIKNKKWKEWMDGAEFKITKVSEPMKQDLTHQRIIARFWEIHISKKIIPEGNWVSVKQENIRNYAFPKVIDTYFSQKLLTLSFF